MCRKAALEGILPQMHPETIKRRRKKRYKKEPAREFSFTVYNCFGCDTIPQGSFDNNNFPLLYGAIPFVF